MLDIQYRTSEHCEKPFAMRKNHIDEDIFKSVLVEEEYGYLRFAEEPSVIMRARILELRQFISQTNILRQKSMQ